MWYVIVLLLSYTSIRGLLQGMIFTKHVDAGHIDEFSEGIRGHKYHPYVHRIFILEAAFWALFCILVGSQRVNFFIKPNNILLRGSLFLMCQLFENMYSFARYQCFVPSTENVLGTGFYVNGGQVTILHAIRWIMGVGLLAIGVLV